MNSYVIRTSVQTSRMKTYVEHTSVVCAALSELSPRKRRSKTTRRAPLLDWAEPRTPWRRHGLTSKHVVVYRIYQAGRHRIGAESEFNMHECSEGPFANFPAKKRGIKYPKCLCGCDATRRNLFLNRSNGHTPAKKDIVS